MYIEQTTSIKITDHNKNVPDIKYDEIEINITFSYEAVINILPQLECDILNLTHLPCIWIMKILDKIKVNNHLIISPCTDVGGLCNNCIFIDISKHKSIESVESLTIHQVFPFMFDHFKLFIHIPSNIKDINITQSGFDATKQTYEIFIVGDNQVTNITNNMNGLNNKNIKICNIKTDKYETMTIEDINNKIKELEDNKKDQYGKKIVMHNKDKWNIGDVKTITNQRNNKKMNQMKPNETTNNNTIIKKHDNNNNNYNIIIFIIFICILIYIIFIH